MPSRERYHRNPEHHRSAAVARYARDPERGRQIQRRYAARNRARIMLKRQAERCARYGVAVELTRQQWEWLLARHGYTCVYCGALELLTERLQLDHAEPLCDGGRHALGNVLPACPACNKHKCKKPLDTWLADLAPELAQAICAELAAQPALWLDFDLGLVLDLDMQAVAA